MYVWLVKFVFYAGKRYQFMITRCSKLAVKKINLDEFDFELYVSFFLFFFLAFWHHLNLFKCCVRACNKSFNISKQTRGTTPTLVPPVCSADH